MRRRLACRGLPWYQAGYPKDIVPALIALNGIYEGQQVHLEVGLDVTVGRNEENLLVLPNDTLVSGRHCVIQHDKGGWVVEDLDSTNGTMLNGNELTRTQLTDGDVVTIGGTRFQFQLRSGKTEPLPSVPPSASDLRATQVVDYDEIMDALPAANAAPRKDYDELLNDLPGSNSVPASTLPLKAPSASPASPQPGKHAPAAKSAIPLPPAPNAAAASSTPVQNKAPARGPTDTYYDQMFDEAGRGGDEDRTEKKAGRNNESTWLDSPNQTNMLLAMGSIGLLFLVMILFFNRLV